MRIVDDENDREISISKKRFALMKEIAESDGLDIGSLTFDEIMALYYKSFTQMIGLDG